MIVFAAILILGSIITIGMFSFKAYGGSFASATMRRRMLVSGNDPAEDRLKDWGLKD